MIITNYYSEFFTMGATAFNLSADHMAAYPVAFRFEDFMVMPLGGMRPAGSMGLLHCGARLENTMSEWFD